MLDLIITIDGPSASGKSSLCQALCTRWKGWDWLSTGVFYRGLAYMILDQKLEKDINQWERCLKQSSWELKKTLQGSLFTYDEKEISSQLYTSDIDHVASQVAQSAFVREALIPYQRAQKQEGRGLIAEGRDCGTVIFKNAPLKIFLTATEGVRVRRRAQQRNESERSVQITQNARDKNDIERPINPLKEPENALVIHSDNMSLEKVEEQVIDKVKSIFGAEHIS